MPIALSGEHEELRSAVERWASVHCAISTTRAAMESSPDELPPVWKEIADQGWLGLHVPCRWGGQGYGLAELAVVVEELGRALAPGPLLPTLVVSGIVERFGSQECRERWLSGLVDGSLPAGLSLGRARLTREGLGGRLSLSGELDCVLGGATARVLLAPADDGAWYPIDASRPGIEIEARDAVDATRSIARVKVSGYEVVEGIEGIDDSVYELAAVIAAAECSGGARWCLETATDHAKNRVQFGRPIGQFQAVKHRVADMLVATEQCSAVAWDAAQAWDGAHSGDSGRREEASLSAEIARSVALGSFADCAKSCVQVLGGIGFTWEHDAHLFLKRAVATRQLLGPVSDADRRVTAMAVAGIRRGLVADLPPEADQVREEIASLIAGVADAGREERRQLLADRGLIAPHWPAPWGRDAGALEQLVIEAEMRDRKIRRPHLGVGAWALPTIIAHGSPEQQERWVRPTLYGTVNWCQLFSEPSAGSDLASLTTRALKVDGGWSITGQKVWTSMASLADFGVCLARSDPEAPKHEGISYFIVDMKSPGVEIRPLREMTGEEMFSEVFLDGVFVPDDALIGEAGSGWQIARTTLANERVSMSSGATFGTGVESIVEMVASAGEDVSDEVLARLGRLLAEAHSIRIMAHRDALGSLTGLGSGASSSVRKLLGAEHEQRMQELGLELCGTQGAISDGSAAVWVKGFLATRCLTIAGGTSEVQRNVMAERRLGLPRDPEPGE